MKTIRSRAKNTLIFSCLHAPYHHDNAHDFLKAQKQKWNIDRAICLGDFSDQFTASRFGSNSKAKGADNEQEELEHALVSLAAIFPELEVLLGNHDVRVEKQAASNGIPTNRIRPIQEVPSLIKPLKGWKFHGDECEIIPGITAIHGDTIKGPNAGEAAVMTYRTNIVMGDKHTLGGVMTYTRKKWQNWCLHVGSLIDPESVATDYAKKHIRKSVLGCGVLLDNKLPIFVPMT